MVPCTEGSIRSKLLSLCAALLLATSARAQEPKSPQLSADDLVRQTVAQETAAASRSEFKHMFRSRKQGPKGSQSHLYVETTDAMAGMLVASNGKPLTPEQQQAELDHLTWLLNNPDQLRKKKAREKEDTERSLRIVKALPDAFRYEYDGTQPGELGLGKVGDSLVRLKFTPNPSYSPPSHVEQVLAGMQGYLLIDASAHRIARIDGTLFRDVSFGWGIFGRLDKGGHFRVQQADVGEGCWEITAMSLHMTGKILMFKSISMISEEVLSDFQRVPANLSFAKGVDLLKSEQVRLAHLQEPESTATKKNTQ
jgi:hypothetical protein